MIVNVEESIADGWLEPLTSQGYRIERCFPVHTRRYRGLDNAEKRPSTRYTTRALRRWHAGIQWPRCRDQS
jgi:hypothetical protein